MYYDQKGAMLQILALYFNLPLSILTYTEGHNAQTVNQLIKRTEQMLEFNFILDNLREYVTIFETTNGITKFRYVNEQFLRHFSHKIAPSESDQVFLPMQR